MAKAKKKTSKRKTKKKTAKRKAKKKTAKRKAKRKTKKKTAKRKAKRKTKTAKRKAKRKTKKKTAKGFAGAPGGAPKGASLVQRAKHAKTLGAALSYIHALSDALEKAYGEIRGLRIGMGKMQEVTKSWSAEVDRLEKAAARDQKKIKQLQAKLRREQKAGKLLADDVRKITAELEAQRKELVDLSAGVRQVRRLKQKAGKEKALREMEAKGARKKERRKKQRKMTAAFKQRDVAGGAGCSLGVLRWGYSGKQDCKPGYPPGEAGRRLANLRHHGIPFNPELSAEEAFDMGYEAGRADGKKPKGGKKTGRKAPKRNKPKGTRSNPGNAGASNANYQSILRSI